MQRENEELRRKVEEEEQKRAQTPTVDSQATEGERQEVTSIEQMQDEGPPPPMEPIDPDVVPQVETNQGQTQVELLTRILSHLRLRIWLEFWWARWRVLFLADPQFFQTQ